MTYPITYRPYVTTVGMYGPYLATDYSRRLKSAQKGPPYVPAVYDFIRARCTFSNNLVNADSYNPPFDARTLVTNQYPSDMEVSTQNQAYERLRGKIYDDVSLGVDFAEARQSLGMITKAVTTLGKSFLQVKRLDFLGAAKTLRMNYAPKGTSKRKSAANNWLEYHFGWTPLIHDIYDAVEVVNNPLKSFQPTRGVGREARDAGVIYQEDTYTICAAMRYQQYVTGQGATVQAISNDTYHTLEQFGLLNPLSIAWELVPFSFIVDWFANVGDVLRAHSDFAGMTLVNRYIFWNYKIHVYNGIFKPKPGYEVPGRVPMEFGGVGLFNQRNTYLVGPTLSLDKLRLPSKARAATAVSLLIQQFSKR